MTRQRDPGFTLIEILVVLAILGVAMGLIIGRGPMNSRGLQARAAAGAIAQSLRAARSQAIATDRDVQVAVDPARHAFALDGGRATTVSRDIPLSVLPPALRGPGTVRLIRFSADGSSSGGQILLGTGRRRIGITVEWLTGQVKVADAQADPGQEGGFTLLEVLIAFVIASLAIGALFGGTAGGLDATATAAKYDEAISLAQSHLAAIGRGEAIKQQETSGAEGEGFNWHLRIRTAGTRQLTLSDQDRANDVKPNAAILYDVVVSESWQAGGRTRQVTLSTRRFDTVQSEAP